MDIKWWGAVPLLATSFSSTLLSMLYTCKLRIFKLMLKLMATNAVAAVIISLIKCSVCQPLSMMSYLEERLVFGSYL